MKRTRLFVAGLVLNALSGLSQLPTLLVPTAGPAPEFINVIDGVLGLATLVGVVMAWRRRVSGVVIMIVGEVLMALTSVPAFFADVPSSVRALAATGLVLTALAIALVAPALRTSRERVASLS